MDVRKNHRDLSQAEKAAFVGAVLALKNNVDSVLHPGAQKRYDDFVEIHKNAMTGPAMFEPMPHGTSLFYPWHRILLRQFELELQKMDPTVTIPYWDWDTSKSPFSADFLGGDGDAQQGQRVITGAFAFSGGKFSVRVWDDFPGDPHYPWLRREMGDSANAYLPTHPKVVDGLNKAPYWPGPSCFERVSEGSLHNPVHNWVGGNMADATSPNDPVFFLHHANLDYLWEQWKVLHPTADPYLPLAGNKGLDAILVFNAPGQPAPWADSWTVRRTLDPTQLGYTYA
jgi:tyrosinase